MRPIRIKNIKAWIMILHHAKIFQMDPAHRFTQSYRHAQKPRRIIIKIKNLNTDHRQNAPT